MADTTRLTWLSLRGGQGWRNILLAQRGANPPVASFCERGPPQCTPSAQGRSTSRLVPCSGSGVPNCLGRSRSDIDGLHRSLHAVAITRQRARGEALFASRHIQCRATLKIAHRDTARAIPTHTRVPWPLGLMLAAQRSQPTRSVPSCGTQWDRALVGGDYPDCRG